MDDDPLYSCGSAAMILAMTALKISGGAAPDAALAAAHEEWREHRAHNTDSWLLSDMRAAVARLTR